MGVFERSEAQLVFGQLVKLTIHRLPTSLK
jgi:hypothetical protein